MDIHTEQGIQHLLVVLQYGHSSNDLMGRLIRGSLKTMTLELGCPGNPFTQDYTAMHFLMTNSCIKTVWQFQHHHKIWIKTDLPSLSISRVNDQFLIQSFEQASIKGTELSKVNRCRICLQVTTLADICNRSGVYILPDMLGWQAKQDIYYKIPLAKPRMTTQNGLETVAIGTASGLSCKPLLSKWLKLLTQSIHCWHWLTSYSTQKLYHWTSQWQIHDCHRGHSNHPKYKIKGSREMQPVPPDCKRVTIMTATTYLTLTIGFGHTATQTQEPVMWQEFIHNLPNKTQTYLSTPKIKRQWATYCTSNYEQPCNCSKQQILRRHTGHCCMDVLQQLRPKDFAWIRSNNNTRSQTSTGLLQKQIS